MICCANIPVPNGTTHTLTDRTIIEIISEDFLFLILGSKKSVISDMNHMIHYKNNLFIQILIDCTDI